MQRRTITGCVAALLVMQAGLLGYNAKVHSPTWDEVGHLVAGISHWELGRFELYSVNPPLVRTIAAAPVVMFADPKIDWSLYRSDPTQRSEVFVGRQMIDLNGADSFHFFFLARLAVIPIALLGGWLCFLWGRDLFGDAAGLIALTLWTFSPNVLAYGSVITPDLGSAVALLGCSYVFWRWLKEPSWPWAISLCASLAVAMLTKSVWLMLPALFLMIYTLRGVGRIWQTRGQSESAAVPLLARFERWLTGPAGAQAGQLVVASALALVMTNGYYGFRGSMKPIGDYTFVSSALTGNEAVNASNPTCVECRPRFVVAEGNRFSDGWLAMIPVPLPENYLRGIDIQTRDFERGWYDPSWRSYMLGNWQQGGWWYFYIVGLLVKVPLATWLMIGVGSVLALFWRPNESAKLGVACLWVPALTLFVIVSFSTGLNRYVRYALPVLPVLFVWASQVGRPLATEFADKKFARKVSGGFAAVACVWLAVTALTHAPHHLSYFNQIAGGSENGHQFLCDSNIDWGQDLRHLQDWISDNPDKTEELSLAYFGAFDPNSVGINYRVPPPLPSDLSQTTRVDRRWLGPMPGWHVVSKNFVVGHSMPLPDGSDSLQFMFAGEGAYTYFQDFQPIDHVGHSMLVYHLTFDQVNQVRQARDLPLLHRRKSPVATSAGSSMAADVTTVEAAVDNDGPTVSSLPIALVHTKPNR